MSLIAIWIVSVNKQEWNLQKKILQQYHKAAEGSNVMIETKSGQSYDGVLCSVDKFMNVQLENVTLTGTNAKNFHSIKQVYIRGNTLKYLNFQSKVIDKLKDSTYNYNKKWDPSDHKKVHKNNNPL